MRNLRHLQWVESTQSADDASHVHVLLTAVHTLLDSSVEQLVEMRCLWVRPALASCSDPAPVQPLLNPTLKLVTVLAHTLEQSVIRVAPLSTRYDTQPMAPVSPWNVDGVALQGACDCVCVSVCLRGRLRVSAAWFDRPTH
jgi:hypothetical protein